MRAASKRIQTRVEPSAASRASSTSAVTPEIGRSSIGTLTEYVYVVPAVTGHPGVISAHPSAISATSSSNERSPTKAVTLGVTDPVENSATNDAVTSTTSPRVMSHTAFDAHKFDSIESGRPPFGPVLKKKTIF